MKQEIVTLSGHIIDSLTLPKVLDRILALGGEFTILEIDIGKTRSQASRAVIRIEARNEKIMRAILSNLKNQGIRIKAEREILLEKAPQKGVFPPAFYSTTNLPTSVFYRGKWRVVKGEEMDLGILYEEKGNRFRTIPMNDVQKGDLLVVGHKGIRTAVPAKMAENPGFRFMASTISSEKPANRLVQETANRIIKAKEQGLKILFVLGPAVVHSGGSPSVSRLIDRGWVDLLFAGNALATHDIEGSFYGTSLGVSLSGGSYAEHGHEHHLRAINKIRHLGGIKAAVRKGVLTSGIMYSCVKKGIPFLLAGSIRDDGPLPEVITDVLEAQKAMRQKIKGVGLTIAAGSVLHGIAVGNLLPASVPLVGVDLNPASLTKFADRGSHQSMGIVMDSASFFSQLEKRLHKG